MPVDPVAAIRGFLSSNGLDPAAPALVGYSAGPDSTCLLHALALAGLGPLRAVYVDHGLRPAAERAAEEALAKATCSSLSVPLTVARLRPGAIADLARARGSGIEAAARDVRYRAFRVLLEREGAGRVYLAHTRDDQLETLLMRAFSGSSCRGLSGIPALAGPLARPFLGLSKADILAWLDERKIAWSTDSSNAEDDYARNRLRHAVIPALATAFPSWEGGLLETARKARLEDEALADGAAPLAFTRSPRGLVAPLALLGAPEALRRRVLLDAATALPGLRASSPRLSSRLADAAFAALRGGAASYKGGGLVLRRVPEGLELGAALDFPGPDGYFVTIADPETGSAGFRACGLSLAAEWREGGGEASASFPGYVRELAFSFPLVVRSRRPGDFLAIKGGHKAVDELLAELGVPADMRDRVPVLQDRRGIVGILGSALGGRDRFRASEVRDTGRYLSIIVKGA